MLRLTNKPTIDGKLLSNPFLKQKKFKIQQAKNKGELTVLLKYHVNGITAVSIKKSGLMRDKFGHFLIRHAKNSVECPWCMTVNRYVYIWEVQIRCNRCIPADLLEDDRAARAAQKLNFLPEWIWVPISSGHVYSVGTLYADGKIYAAT